VLSVELGLFERFRASGDTHFFGGLRLVWLRRPGRPRTWKAWPGSPGPMANLVMEFHLSFLLWRALDDGTLHGGVFGESHVLPFCRSKPQGECRLVNVIWRYAMECSIFAAPYADM
jgi:hypothetical protein